MVLAQQTIIEVVPFLGGVVIGALGLICLTMMWYAVTNERIRGRLRYRLLILKLRLKFKRDAITCQVCGGKGTYPHSGGFGDIDFDCTRCEGSGIAYLYYYRFNWWTPRDPEGFAIDQDLVELILGDAAQRVQTKAMARAVERREDDD